MEPRLFRYIWRHSKREQMVLLLIVALSVPSYFLVLDLPVRIINGPIMGEDMDRYFAFTIPSPFGAGDLIDFEGYELTRLGALTVLSFAFLALVIVNSAFNYAQNSYKRVLGERLLRKLRYELIDRALRFPMARFRNTRGSEIASMVKDEVEELGEFIGDAYAVPLYQSAQALTAIVFIMLQNVYLGLIAVGMLVITSSIIPALRRRLIALERERQLAARTLSGRVGEIVDGALEVRTNGTGYLERANFVNLLGDIFFIRSELYHWKFFIKSLNDFLAQVTPFLFYLVGGYFALRGNIDIGQLVAVIAAYKELPNPIKQIINWDQARIDVQSKYQTVVEQFIEDDLLPPLDLNVHKAGVEPLKGTIEAQSLSVEELDGTTLLHPVSFSFPLGAKIALSGGNHSGAEVVIQLLAGQRLPSAGRLQISGIDAAAMPPRVRGERVAYLPANPYFSQSTMKEALLYGLMTRPSGQEGTTTDPHQGRHHPQQERFEAELLKHPYVSRSADWVNYKAVGVSNQSELEEQVAHCLSRVELEHDVYRLGLRMTPLDISEVEQNAFLTVRQVFRRRIRDHKAGDLIEVFRPDYFHQHSTIAQNLIFGSVGDPQVFEPVYYKNRIVLDAIADTGCDRVLFDFGVNLAAVVTELIGGADLDYALLNKLDLIDEKELMHYETLLKAPSNRDFLSADEETKGAFFELAGRYCEVKHRLGLFDKQMMKTVRSARTQIRLKTPRELRRMAVRFFNPNRYDVAQSVGANLIFGRVNSSYPDAASVVEGILRDILEEQGIMHRIVDYGLRTEIGSGGKNLALSQRQKLNVARALLKGADLILINKGLSDLDPKTEAKILKTLTKRASGGVVMTINAMDHARCFDRVLTFENGRLVEEPEAIAAK
ncbi:MAG: ABC transporter transmembrane domain-containing protein [Pseudomonadota bacterium]